MSSSAFPEIHDEDDDSVTTNFSVTGMLAINPEFIDFFEKTMNEHIKITRQEEGCYSFCALRRISRETIFAVNQPDSSMISSSGTFRRRSSGENAGETQQLIDHNADETASANNGFNIEPCPFLQNNKNAERNIMVRGIFKDVEHLSFHLNRHSVTNIFEAMLGIPNMSLAFPALHMWEKVNGSYNCRRKSRQCFDVEDPEQNARIYMFRSRTLRPSSPKKLILKVIERLASLALSSEPECTTFDVMVSTCDERELEVVELASWASKRAYANHEQKEYAQNCAKALLPKLFEGEASVSFWEKSDDGFL